MRMTLSLLMLSMSLSTLALADSWSGKLVDAVCYDKQQSTAGCDATSATKTFALDVSGKVFKFDESSNAKAATALKNRADRAADPTKPQSTEIKAKVDGTESSGMIVAAAIEVQ